jgi:enterochelin esterase-like enzyme
MHKFLFILLFGLFGSFCGKAQGFPEFLNRMGRVPEGQRQAVADSFLQKERFFPIVQNDTTVHFVYTGPVKSVALAGDVTGWKPGPAFSRIPGTQFWYLSAEYENDARLDYKLVIDSTHWITDPLNPNSCMSGFGPNSELRMPRNQVPPESVYRMDIPHGKVLDTTFISAARKNSRKVKIILPAGYPEPGIAYPLIVFHDGPEFFEIGRAGQVIDYLVAQKTIRPVIAVFVEPVERDDEYSGTKRKAYTRFITEELMPEIDRKFRTSRNPGDRGMAGISNGGNISLYIGIAHPEQFGRISVQSSNVMPEIFTMLDKMDSKETLFYLDIGKYDIDVLIPMAENLRNALAAKGLRHEYREWNEGHSWCNWRDHLRVPLTLFFGTQGK